MAQPVVQAQAILEDSTQDLNQGFRHWKVWLGWKDLLSRRLPPMVIARRLGSLPHGLSQHGGGPPPAVSDPGESRSKAETTVFKKVIFLRYYSSTIQFTQFKVYDSMCQYI